MLKKKVLSEAAYYDIDSMFAYISQEGKQAYEGLVGFAGGCGRKAHRWLQRGDHQYLRRFGQVKGILPG